MYLALAVQRDPATTPADLLVQVPLRRFDWYILDLKQYFDTLTEEDSFSAIYVPTSNRLNLAMFSLLWGSLWVSRFFKPLVNAPTLLIPKRLIAEEGVFGV